ncbi:carboxymuconolactone decarboxylase [Photobacterium gaetbulicola]|uniref:Carboxymuconolactone decarboxylase n=1 Tax=Photobacterium gaetbulicola TaxID=1295392 RepID=A0A0B9GD64_9GAMM|nr:carboxymuconolactone decarboxylase family protein [Photobacterium gaetbulicola]KHT62790.1 carboxymuconolactone decarboxylase [Photobacterium gaetbulicola]
MIPLQLHTIESAPESSRTLLQSSIDNFGWIPNQSAYMAESPALLASYQNAHELFSQCSLTEEEKAVVWITVGSINQCPYTVQAHAWIALHSGVSAEIVDSLITPSSQLPSHLEALQRFTKDVALAQGSIPQESAINFLNAGYSKQNMLDVILGVSQKTMSTLLNSLARTEIEPQFITQAES